MNKQNETNFKFEYKGRNHEEESSKLIRDLTESRNSKNFQKITLINTNLLIQNLPMTMNYGQININLMNMLIYLQKKNQLEKFYLGLKVGMKSFMGKNLSL